MSHVETAPGSTGARAARRHGWAVHEQPDRFWEREVKFCLPARHVAVVRGWMASVCQPERAYPPAWVVTVYFDTPRLELLDAKVNSDYFKTKVRVRWYRALTQAKPMGHAFVECKVRAGSKRGKVRVQTDALAADVATWTLTDGRWSRFVEALPSVAHLRVDRLEPVLRLRYRRDRYLGLIGGRFAIDSDITVEAVNPSRVSRARLLDRLPHVIVEYKGDGDLPASFASLARMGARKASYSKYLASFEHATRCSSRG